VITGLELVMQMSSVAGTKHFRLCAVLNVIFDKMINSLGNADLDKIWPQHKIWPARLCSERGCALRTNLSMLHLDAGEEDAPITKLRFEELWNKAFPFLEEYEKERGDDGKNVSKITFQMIWEAASPFRVDGSGWVSDTEKKYETFINQKLPNMQKELLKFLKAMLKKAFMKSDGSGKDLRKKMEAIAKLKTPDERNAQLSLMEVEIILFAQKEVNNHWIAPKSVPDKMQAAAKSKASFEKAKKDFQKAKKDFQKAEKDNLKGEDNLKEKMDLMNEAKKIKEKIEKKMNDDARDAAQCSASELENHFGLHNNEHFRATWSEDSYAGQGYYSYHKGKSAHVED
jgi:hypothetical protein